MTSDTTLDVAHTLAGLPFSDDLWQFYGRYRQDGWGRPAYEPAMMVALLLHA